MNPNDPVPAAQIETASPSGSDSDKAGAAPSAGSDAPPLAESQRAKAPVAAMAPVTDGSDGSEAGQSGDGAASESPEAGEPARKPRNRRRGRGKGAASDAAGPAPEESSGEAAVEASSTQQAPAAAPVATAVDPALTAERFGEVLSGAYDAEAPEPDDAASLELSTKRVLRPEPEAPKLHKLLAQSGVGSRRDMEQFIQDGKVTVNGEVAHIGMRVSHGDRIAVDGKPVKLRLLPGPARVLAYHKPAGEVVTFNDPEGRPTVFRRLPRLPNGKWQSVGRLDINTEGLLLFTNSGELANQLMHPRFGVEREYAVRVLGSLTEEQKARLLEGIEIEGQAAAFRSIEDGGGEGVNHWYRVVITEGRNREVRKLFGAVELAVSRLIRIRYGCVVLPRGLRRGVWVELGDGDVRAIRQLAGGGRGRPANEGEPRAAAQPQRAQQGRGGKPGRGPAQGGNGAQHANGGRPPRDRSQRPDSARQQAPREPIDRDADPSGEDFTRIPNPLEQTFDRRFAKGPRRIGAQGFGQGGAPEIDLDGPMGTIPNPLEQTFDKRFVKGSQRINAGFGRHDAQGSGASAAGKKKGGPKQPDPMQTAVGYIGADAFFTKVGGKRGGRGGGGGGGGGFGGGGRGRSR